VRGLAVVLVLGLPVAASAETAAAVDDSMLTLDRAWPAVPEDHAPCLEDRITDHLTDWGNHFGDEVARWSHDHAVLRVDGRRRRAELHFGGGNDHLAFHFDSNWLFADGKAYAKVHLDLAVQGHRFELELPGMDVSRDSYRNQDMVTVNVSVLERRF
jgi:hypothetical protein